MPQAAPPLSSQSPQQSPSASATPVTPLQIFWDVAKLALGLLVQLYHVLKPVQARYPKQSWQVARLYADLPRILLTLRFAPERITVAQLRHLHRARHLLQALFGYTLPTLGPRTSPSANAGQTPSASPENAAAHQFVVPPSGGTPASANPPSPSTLGARTPSSATTPSPTVPEVPEVPAVSAVPSPNTPSPASSNSQSSSHNAPASPTFNIEHLTANNSHNPSSAIHNPHSSFSPYIPDAQTLSQALRADSLPPNCAGALLDDPGEALVKALRQLHAVYFSLYPNQSPSSSSANPQSAICNPQSSHSHSPSQSEMESPSPVNPQSAIHNLQSPSVHPVHSPSPAQSEISNLKSEIPDSPTPHSAFPIPHSDAPP